VGFVFLDHFTHHIVSWYYIHRHNFYSRCNDVLELVETTRHFRLLADAAEIGGAGSMSLDALVKEIHLKYSQVMKEFFTVVENVLSIDGSQNFERAFFKFRTVVKVIDSTVGFLNLKGK
jgi:dynein heavy chain